MLEKMGFLKPEENKESFLKRIANIFPTLDPRYQDIVKAYNCAKDAFRDKFRDEKNEGQRIRYFEHLRVVTLIIVDYLMITDPVIIISGLLHDIVEDSPYWDIERVQREFGIEVARLVQYLSKPPVSEYNSKEERNHIYNEERAQAAPRKFFLVKISDRLHNTITLSGCTLEKQRRKIAETKRYYLPQARRELILYHELKEAIAMVEATWQKK